MAAIFDKYHNQHFSGGKSSHAKFNILKKIALTFLVLIIWVLINHSIAVFAVASGYLRSVVIRFIGWTPPHLCACPYPCQIVITLLSFDISMFMRFGVCHSCRSGYNGCFYCRPLLYTGSKITLYFLRLSICALFAFYLPFIGCLLEMSIVFASYFCFYCCKILDLRSIACLWWVRYMIKINFYLLM